MKICLLILILFTMATPLFAQSGTTKTIASTDSMIYTCTMHPEVVSGQPGKCPKCGMDLVQKKTSSPEHTMNMMMCPMHGMVDSNHQHSDGEKKNKRMMRGMGIGMGAMMVVMMIVILGNR